MRDYRDKLRDLLEEIHSRDGITRYRIAKQSGISEQTLSNVMHKRRNLSIDALQKLLESLGYEIQFARVKDGIGRDGIISEDGHASAELMKQLRQAERTV